MSCGKANWSGARPSHFVCLTHSALAARKRDATEGRKIPLDAPLQWVGRTRQCSHTAVDRHRLSAAADC
jgi:hypothetical protein